ncbi:MAG TPA: hypothetical protein VJA16_03635 [Thermoanaerobaculia bacterium]
MKRARWVDLATAASSVPAGSMVAHPERLHAGTGTDGADLAGRLVLEPVH